MELWLPLFIPLAAVVGVAGLILLYARRVLETMLTANFRAAEAISQGHTPAEWVPAISRQAALRRIWLPWARPPSEAELAAQRVERLYRFFANSTFFEDEAARSRLLADLTAVRQRWLGMTWDAIRAEV